MSELVKAWQSGHFSETQIVEAYNTTYLEFRQALRAADLPLPSNNPPGLAAEIYYEYHVGIDENYESMSWITEEYGISFTSAYKYKSTSTNCSKHLLKSKSSIQQLLARGYTQVEVSEMTGVSQATVSNYNPKRRTKSRGKSLTESEWQSLLADAKRFTISELARLYKVSRAQIYSRMKKC